MAAVGLLSLLLLSSMGYGDVRPSGPLRLLAGAEALHGLLLIGWSASFAYISMERFREGADDGSDAADESRR